MSKSLKYALTYFAGAATVTGCVLATGAYTVTFFSLGFLAAVAITALVCRAIGAARLGRWMLNYQSNHSTPVSQPARPVRSAMRHGGGGKTGPTPARVAVSAVTPITSIEHEVISALVNLSAPRKVAAAAVAQARKTAPPEFEQLFRVALNIVQGKAA